MSNPFPVDDVSLTAVTDIMSSSGIDTIWLDLDGDMVPETMIQTDGPFALDDSGAGGAYDDGLVGEPINTLLPWDVEPGATDVWSLPDDGADWCDMNCYDPMTVPSDWTVDGYADATGYENSYDTPVDGGPFEMEDPGAFTDTGGYYDSTGYYDTTTYYDTTDSGYYDTSAEAYDTSGGWDSSAGYDTGVTTYDSWDSWDPSGADTTFDTGYSDPSSYYDDTSSGYDATAYDDGGAGYDAGYDPTADQGTEVFEVEANTEITDTWDSSLAMEQSQPWTDLSEDQSAASWDLYDASNDAWAAGDYELSYDLDAASTDQWNASYDSYDYSNDAYMAPTGYDATTTYDTTSYDSSTWETSAYDTSGYTTTESYTYDTPVSDSTSTYDSGSDW